MAIKETNAVVAPVGAPAKQGTKLPAQLLSISDKVLANTNGTEFRACSIKLDGDSNTYSAMIWEKSVANIELGTCSVEARVEDNTVYLTVLGNGANRITLASLLALTGNADLDGEF
jgi:hypothetical protein